MKKHKAIRSLVNEAKSKNNMKAQYQLYRYYRDGDFVESDKEAADYYWMLAEENFRKSQVRLKNIRLIDFRGFPELNIDLSTEHVVIAANNGYGKTGILESIYACLTWLIRNFRGGNTNGWFLKEEDIRAYDGVLSSSVKLDLAFFQGDDINCIYSIELSKALAESDEKQDSSYQEFKLLAELYRDFSNKGYPFPAISFYSVERGSVLKKADFKKAIEHLNKDGKGEEYGFSISSSPRFEVFLSWLIKNKTGKSMAYALSEERKEYNKNLATLHVLKDLNSKEDAVINIIKSLEEKIKDYDPEEKNLKNDVFSKNVQLLFSAIYKFMPDISNIKFSYDEKNNSIDLTCMKNGCEISVSQLSQGEKTMLSLVCDIAFRLISLREDFSNPFDGPGIIIIDEIDLHLHPVWQQSVLVRLKDVFPKIQFVISTHSPNVLSTISNECIRKIVPQNNGGYDVEIPYFSLGAESSFLQMDIQDVSSRPETLDIIQKLNKYKELLQKDEWDTPQAEALFKDLCDWAEGKDPVISKLKLDVSLRKRRRGIK